MVVIALAFAAVSSAALTALLLRRRRPSRRASATLLTRVEPLPAGLKHLAAGVSDLSDLRLHLPAATRALERRRLGALLGLR